MTEKPKMNIVIIPLRFSCAAGLDFWRIQKALKGMPKIRHEKGKANTFDPKLFREKMEGSQ
tara:strand:+ start:523 stop:705 length:183 start_codon:yes stop_codon:yes gene_type:complete